MHFSIWKYLGIIKYTVLIDPRFKKVLLLYILKIQRKVFDQYGIKANWQYVSANFSLWDKRQS